jgi:radical SAM protein with 4Fe4S-binding SPASM domain
MRYYLSRDCALKRLERPAVYRISRDELYELDEDAFAFLETCASPDGAPAGGGHGEFIRYCMREGILDDTGPYGALRPHTGRSPGPSLRYLELQVTGKCNLRCRHCYLGPPGKAEMPLREIARVLEEFQAMQGLRVLITGGEPTLHGEFEGLNSILPGYALRKVLFTNGTGRFPEGLNVDEIQVSVDGLRAGHEVLRGVGTFQKALRFMEEAMGRGMEVSVATMVHAGNLGDFPAMERLFTGMGVRDWTVDVPSPEGSLRESPGLQLPPEVAGKYLGFGFGSGPHGGAGGGRGASCGRHLMAVMADGSCAKCSFYAGRPVGRLGEGLARCWSRVRNIGLEALDCDCANLEACRGGCRYRAGLLGSPIGKDLYMCAYYDTLENASTCKCKSSC